MNENNGIGTAFVIDSESFNHMGFSNIFHRALDDLKTFNVRKQVNTLTDF